jgi:molybdopterin converting factor small subunit
MDTKSGASRLDKDQKQLRLLLDRIREVHKQVGGGSKTSPVISGKTDAFSLSKGELQEAVKNLREHLTQRAEAEKAQNAERNIKLNAAIRSELKRMEENLKAMRRFNEVESTRRKVPMSFALLR